MWIPVRSPAPEDRARSSLFQDDGAGTSKANAGTARSGGDDNRLRISSEFPMLGVENGVELGFRQILPQCDGSRSNVDFPRRLESSHDPERVVACRPSYDDALIVRRKGLGAMCVAPSRRFVVAAERE